MPRALGKKPAVIDPRVPAFHQMMSTRIVPPPISNWYAAVGEWDMYGNDNWGDCVPAAALHSIVQRTTYSGVPVSFSPLDVQAVYELWGNFNPADPSTDQGCLMSAAMPLWIKNGVPPASPADQPASYCTINIQNVAMLQLAVALTGSSLIGMNLPARWLQTDYLMDLDVDGTVGVIAGGHCVLIVGYRTDPVLGLVFDVISWGQRFAAPWRALRLVIDEGYCVLDRDWFTSGTAGVDPAGVDWSALNAAMQPIMAG